MNENRTLTPFQMRLLFLGLLTSICVVLVGGRLFYLMVTMRETLQERAVLQHQHTLKLEARRGTILDRNGRQLATSVEVESVYAVPKAFKGALVTDASLQLSTCLSLPLSRISARLEGDRSFVWLERKAKPRVVRCIRDLNLAGIGFLNESRRYYPKRSLAAHILGYVGLDNTGMSGVEYALEDEIRGEPGRRIIWTDARNRRAASRVDAKPRPGRAAFLTIDENLQHIAESELEQAIRESHSKSGIAIIMRPETGELLAIASFPSFNPNRYGDYPEGHWRNRAVTDVYEPGSTFKFVAAAAALQEGVTTEDERIDCGRGMIRVGGSIIRDSHAFDVLTFREVVEQSSNVGMIRIGQRLGKERFEKYIRAFGFGETTGIELPAESRGILRPSKTWGPVTLAAISFGQEIGVTPLQMVTATNVIAAGGYLMRPHLLLGLGGADGSLETPVSPEPVRRVIDTETARRLTDLLVGVVERGTGQRAKLPSYVVAGKTGTAQKAVRGGYSKTDYIASFVGFAPAGRPALTALVILDSPEGDHSGSRAAGVFARIMRRALRYLAVPPSDEAPIRIAKVWPQMRPILGGTAQGPARNARNLRQQTVFEAWTPKDPLSDAAGGAPDVIGLSARDGLVRFVARGIVPEILGQGFVLEQVPRAGHALEPGTRARLVLSPVPVGPGMPGLQWEDGVTVATFSYDGDRMGLGRAGSARRGSPVQRNEITD
ncbi:MAG: stage V sporulation protein D [Acidobacteria bacterium]|nr:MAG: stage V sporulation protein D [Acidobacteriota bacterium]